MSLPIICESLTISDAGGTTSAVTYTLNTKDSVESMFNITPKTTMIDAGRTILNGYEIEVSFITFDSDITSDTRIQTTGATLITTLARVVMNGVVGAQKVTVDNIGLYVSNPYVNVDGRLGKEIKGTGTYIGSPITIATAS